MLSRAWPIPRRVYKQDETFEAGGYKVLREGKDVLFVTAGYMVHEVLKVTDELAKSGKKAGVIDAYGLPLKDTGILDIAVRSGGRIITVEDNYTGGLDAELATQIATSGAVKAQGFVRAADSQERTRAAGCAGLFAYLAQAILAAV